jgi:aminopeptidase N
MISFRFLYLLLIVCSGLQFGCFLAKESRPTSNANEVPQIEDTAAEPVVDVVLTDEIVVKPEVPKTKSYQPVPTQTCDLVHTDLSVAFDLNKKYLLGKAKIRLKPHWYNISEVVLDAKGFDIKQIGRVTVNGTVQPLSYTYPNNLQLHIALDKNYTRNDTITIYVDYVARPDDLVAKYPEQFTYENKGLYFINADGDDDTRPQEIWTQGETETSSCWFPTIESPSQKTTQSIDITIPNNLVSLSNGKMVRRVDNKNGTHTDFWEQKLPHPPYLFAITISNYNVTTDKWKRKDGSEIDVSYYLMPEFGQYARNIFGKTPKMMTVFSDKLGYEYPWDKYSQAVVHNFVSGAMENTSCTTFYEGVYATPEQLKDFDSEDIISHELFHHWFGDLVTCESWANIALNESFATYGEYIWFENEYGKDRADTHISEDLKAYLNEAEHKQEPIIRYYYKDPDDLFDRHSYQKGCRVLHVLRNYVGDEAFFAALKNYLHRYEYKNVELANLRMEFEQVTGEDLNWFFDQWFLSAGHPVLDITYSYDSTAQQTKVRVVQSQNNGRIFRLPTNIATYDANGKKTVYPVTIATQDTTFSLATTARPALVNFDANKVLLCEKTENKTVANYIFQYQNAANFVDRLEALTALSVVENQAPEQKKAVTEVFKQALSSPNKKLQRMARYYLK